MLPRSLPRSVVAATAAIGMTAGLGLTATLGPATLPAAAQTFLPAATAQVSDFTLHTEPDQGISFVYDLINGATTSIDLTMYELQDTTAEDDLGAAAARGVDVRVILDHREMSANTTAYNYLSSHGVHVVWSSSAYYYTHEKSMVADNSTALIMTLNLQSQYYSTSRDFAVADTNASDIAAMDKVFNADFAGTSVTPTVGADLVWSPTNSQAKILALINGATSSLRIYSEEMDDTTITNALVSAAERGVAVQVVGENEGGEYDSEYTTLANAGVQISYYSSATGFYIHGKVIEADYNTSSAKVFIGSENFSNTSLNENRELGLIISIKAIMSSIATSFAADFADGTRFS
jgi:phosphatidylserine/phosphatidylglycerophosphate/cardiolipin synthase-like enzyme